MDAFKIRGNLVDVHQQRIYGAELLIEGARITSITEIDPSATAGLGYIMPGFIDAHVHIESSMLIPSEFARMAVVHGTVATVSDPHEIANVCGLKGVSFMIDNGKTVPFKFNFGAPSCVPATSFETAGAIINSDDIQDLLRSDDILYLTEMMNFPGVLNEDKEVLMKIAASKKYNKPVDGHAPGLRGEEAKKYIDAGISTDHECFTKEEALDKLQYGMKIIIREGSAAKNFEALIDLLNDYPDRIMFCSDDKHPDSLAEGHINLLCGRAIAKGIDVFKVLKAACVNPVEHYKLKVGLLRKNDFADFIIVKDLVSFKVLKTYVNGILVSEGGRSLINSGNNSGSVINNFSCKTKTIEDLAINYNGRQVPVIEAIDGQLITNKIVQSLPVKENKIVPDIENDILKIVIVNRYRNAPVSVAFIKNFGLKNGALASSVAHDSHNIVAVGTDDESLCIAINAIIESKGGISCYGKVHSTETNERAGKEINMLLPLKVAGLMSNGDGYEIAAKYSAMDKAAKDLGSKLQSPFMTLSFMALLVIPHIKISDLGLFDGDTFSFMA